MQAIKRF